MLTLPVRERSRARPAYEALRATAISSGEGFIALAREASSDFWQGRLETADGYIAERWVVMLQAINHATEHREQIKSMLTALGVTPPNLSGWAYGEATQSLVPQST
jgi:uncharacterized damage-inducible protein DinB